MAILAVVLFGISALAVEITDMFSRDRAVQTTADLAAFAGAQDLPDSCDAFDSALKYLNEPENGVMDDDAPSTFGAVEADMEDGETNNGEIEVLRGDRTRIPPGLCSDDGRFIRVTTPPRKKKFTFGAAIGAATEGNVQAVATVALRGLGVSVLPLSLPANCPSGLNYVYVDNSIRLQFSPKGSPQGPVVSSVSPSPTVIPAPSSITVVVTSLSSDPTEQPTKFDFSLFNPDGTRLRYEVSGPGLLGSWAETQRNPSSYSATYSVALPANVRAISGSWKVRATQGAPDRWTDDENVGTLIVGSSSSASCPEPSTGDFGLLESPRNDQDDGLNSVDQKRTKNFIFGIDHDLGIVRQPEPDVPCSANGSPYPDAILDQGDNPTPEGANCVNVKTGGTRDMVTSGLVHGINASSDVDGRLVASDESPEFEVDGDCRVAGDSDFRWQKNRRVLVNTVLSCYLADGSDLSDVMRGEPNSLQSEIIRDPRFFFLPVIKTSFRPQNSDRDGRFWPIVEFRGAFITNESDLGGDASCDPDGGASCNGLEFNSESEGIAQLKSIQAFTFPLRALPEEVEQPGNGSIYRGGPKDFLLIE